MSSLDIFFSEYVEGSGNNKALEIYNGTTAPINLAASNYVVPTYFNGQTVPDQTFVLTGTVAAGDVYVLALNNGTFQAIIDQADQTTTDQFGWYNGNDAIVLRKGGSGGQVVDSIGQIGVAPATEWGTGLISTADNTLRRTRNVTDGDPNPNDTFSPSLQWQGFPQNTVGDLGSHYAAPVLNNSGFPTLTAINEDTPAASNTGTPISTLISGLVTDINSDPQAIAVTGADNSNGTWQYSVNGGNSWTPFGAVSDTNATLLGWTSLYAGQLGTPPASQPWMALGNVNQANPLIGPVASQTLNGGSTTLNSLANQSIYAGYSTHTLGFPSLAFSPKNSAVPVLDRTLGYRVRFDVKINSESHTFADSDKNGDNLSDRAGFSLVAISSDGQKGVEIGFWDNEIWVQKDGISDSGPLFTHDTANASGDRWFGDTTQLSSYELAVLGDNFTLFRNGTAILNNRPLRNYTSFTGALNPYKTANFLFFGDDTTSASASFELKNVAVKSAEPRVRFVPNQDYFGTSSSLTFRAWDTSDNIASGTTGVNVSVNGSTSPFSSESETATITVNPVNDAPSFIKGGDLIVSHNAGPQTFPGWATAISPGPANESAQTVSFQVVVGNDDTALFSVLPAIDSLGQLTFTPLAGLIGTATINLTLRDNGGIANGGIDTSASQTFVINVTNQQPWTQSDSYSIPHDKVFNLPAPGVLANDDKFDGDALTAKLDLAPKFGKVVFNSDGSFSYTPNPGFAGIDNFTYTASNGVSPSAPIPVELNVTNLPPGAESDRYRIPHDKVFNLPAPGVLANDDDLDGDALTAKLDLAPKFGKVVFNSDGSFSYTPNPGFAGFDNFTYTVSDGVSPSAPISVNLEVNNFPPGAESDRYRIPHDKVFNLSAPGVLANDDDLDGDALTAKLDLAPK
ncbi:Ig-like domain-containing protein, partial [Microcoleus sp. AR_TQ3_B6]|uniref:choice-of-anchor Y domain-containing protein n=1 Tax=Microcoleus sp. AR_TQ3_B6 TaxID=3055284 RepID=UPI002FD10041